MISYPKTPFGILLLRHRKPKTEEVALRIMERCCERHNPCPCPETCERLYHKRAKDWNWGDPIHDEKADNKGSRIQSGNWLECNCYLAVTDRVSMYG
jgi:hypothetical protein